MAINNFGLLQPNQPLTKTDKLLADIQNFNNTVIPNLPPLVTPPVNVPKYTKFGDNLATLGGFGDQPGELLTQNELLKMNQDQIDAYNKTRKKARTQGIAELLMRFGDALQGKNATELAYGRQVARDQEQAKAAYEEAIQIAEASGDLQKANLLRSLGFPGYQKLQYEKAISELGYGKNNKTSLMQNAAALAEKRKRYANMTEAEKESKDGVLLLQEINDFAGLGGALKYDARTAFDLSSAETSGKQGVSFGEGPLTKGEVSTDEKFGTFYVNYIEKGRGAKNIANAERLEDAEFILKYAAQNGIGISGVPAGIIANRPTLSAFFNPEGVMSQERVASVIQQSLKEILGGQFTEKEGIALIQRGYNPSLSPEENLERLLDLKAQVDQIIESEQTAVDYYENNNKSLRGFKGKRYTKEDFNRDLVKDYTMDVIELTDQDLEDAYMKANEDSLWIKTLEKEITRRADKKR